MGQNLLNLHHRQAEPDEGSESYEDGLSPDERRAYQSLLREAEAAGATLAKAGQGGRPPSFILGVARRDKFTCKRCGGQDNLTFHHKGGIPRSKWLSKMGHQNIPQNFVTVCMACEDAQHNEAREDGVDSSQVTPEGDVGTKRDKGKPVAEPES